MKLVVFGLTVSSSWGNGHATLWRGLIQGLARLGVQVVFFERDAPYYARHRDLHELPAGELVLYPDWESVAGRAAREAAEADAAIVTSYCPDARAAASLVIERARRSVFYDMDTPVTLARLAGGERVDYLPAEGLLELFLDEDAVADDFLTEPLEAQIARICGELELPPPGKTSATAASNDATLPSAAAGEGVCPGLDPGATDQGSPSGPMASRALRRRGGTPRSVRRDGPARTARGDGFVRDPRLHGRAAGPLGRLRLAAG